MRASPTNAATVPADTDPRTPTDLEDAADLEPDAADPIDRGRPVDPRTPPTGDPGGRGCDPTDAGRSCGRRRATRSPTCDRALADVDARAARRAAQPDGDHGLADHGPDAPQRLRSIGRQRHDALRDLLTDTTTSHHRGEPAPAHLTIIATLAAVHDQLGALPAQLLHPNGRSTALPPDTLQRLGCHSQLDAVLLDAAGAPVGAAALISAAAEPAGAGSLTDFACVAGTTSPARWTRATCRLAAQRRPARRRRPPGARRGRRGRAAPAASALEQLGAVAEALAGAAAGAAPRRRARRRRRR